MAPKLFKMFKEFFYPIVAHEFGHYTVAYLLKTNPKFRISRLGISVKYQKPNSSIKDKLISVAGPAMQSLYYLLSYKNSSKITLAYTSLIFNLSPFENLDGIYIFEDKVEKTRRYAYYFSIIQLTRRANIEELIPHFYLYLPAASITLLQIRKNIELFIFIRRNSI